MSGVNLDSPRASPPVFRRVTDPEDSRLKDVRRFRQALETSDSLYSGDTSESIPTPTLMCNESNFGNLASQLPTIGGILAQSVPCTPERTIYTRDDLLGIRALGGMTPETPNSVRINRYFENQGSSDDVELACDPGVQIESPASEASHTTNGQLQRIVRPDALVVTYRFHEDEQGRMLVFDWNNAARDEHVIVGDYADYMSDVVQLHDHGGFGMGIVRDIVALEIEVAVRMGLLSEEGAEVL